MKKFLCLVLLSGIFGAAGVVPTTARADEKQIACSSGGNVNLRISGDEKSGYLDGWIGSIPMNATINSNRIYGSLWDMNTNRQFLVDLDIERMASRDFNVRGWIGQAYVNWYTSSASIFGYFVCLQY